MLDMRWANGGLLREMGMSAYIRAAKTRRESKGPAASPLTSSSSTSLFESIQMSPAIVTNNNISHANGNGHQKTQVKNKGSVNSAQVINLEHEHGAHK